MAKLDQLAKDHKSDSTSIAMGNLAYQTLDSALYQAEYAIERAGDVAADLKGTIREYRRKLVELEIALRKQTFLKWVFASLMALALILALSKD